MKEIKALNQAISTLAERQARIEAFHLLQNLADEALIPSTAKYLRDIASYLLD